MGPVQEEEIRVELDMVEHNFTTLVTSVEDNTLLHSRGGREADIHEVLVKFCDQNMEVPDLTNITKKIHNDQVGGRVVFQAPTVNELANKNPT